MTIHASQPTPAPDFHGLFVGVNQFLSPAISNLAAAVRDASALHALFSDNLGLDCELLTDQDATTDRLRSELTRLQTVSQDADTVVVSFSGHGSDTHEIITYDADPYHLSKTALSLDEFTDLVSAIPAKHLLVVLDCCFSGGAGAKVLHAPARPRGAVGGVPLSTEALLGRMAGTGRMILTASTADQPAWEDPRLGHGLLTHHLLQALLGRSGDARGDQIHLLDLLRYVTDEVKAQASGSYRARQEPTLRGQWDGDVVWPVLVPGARFEAMYPPAAPAPVSADLASLRHHGISDDILDRWAATLPALNQLQQDAVNEARLLGGRNVLVMAPTSSGKTMVGELAAVQATQNGGRSVFLLPTKALVNEQYDKFDRTYGPAGIRTVRATGDFNDEVSALLQGQFDMAVLTYEKFAGLATANPYLLGLVSVVVVDEIQTIIDTSRGPYLEFLLTLLRSRKEDGLDPQIIGLSAVLGELCGLDSWLDAYLLRRDDRPVPLDEGVLDLTGAYRYIDAQGSERTELLLPAVYGDARAKTLLVPLVANLVAEGQQVIVIRGLRGEAKGAAAYLTQALGLPPAAEALAALPTGDPSIASDELRRCLQGGVAFHISDLERDERRVIEDEFRRSNSGIRVIVATTTLAQGVNMPAETVVMPELSRRMGARETRWYSVAEYKNIAGRAGRLGLVDKGRAIVLAPSYADRERIWTQYVNGRPEDVHSTLLDPSADLFTLVLRVVAITQDQLGGGGLSGDDVIGVLASSFAAHQNRLLGQGDAFEPAAIGKALDELRSQAFVEEDAGGLRLTELGTIVAGSGLAVRSAVTVAGVFRGLRPEELNRATLISAAQLTGELDETRLTVNVKGVAKEVHTFTSELARQGTAPAVLNALAYNVPGHVAYAARAKKAVACLLWMHGTPAAQLEQIVMQHYFDRSAIGPIRAVASRTQDVIGTVVAIATMLHPTQDLSHLAALLPVQLELGIPADLAPLAVAGASLSREQYLALAAQGLTKPDLIEGATNEKLLRCLGGRHELLQSLREAVTRLQAVTVVPSLTDVLPLPTD
jgi:helicase